MRVRRAITRVVSSYGGPALRMTLSRSSVAPSMPRRARARRRSSARTFAIRHSGVMISMLSARTPGSSRRDGADLSCRLSPKRGAMLDVFDDLIGLARVFPHPNLRIDVMEVAIDEAVESAKELCSADAPSFVNGILGAVQREEVRS